MRTLFPLALLALSLPAVAQPSFGVKVGVNAADVSDIEEGVDLLQFDGVEKQSRLGLVVGLTADVPFASSLSFRPEVLYTQKGYVVDVDLTRGGPEDGFQGSLTSEFDYLEVPLLLAYTFPTSNALEVAVEAGPTLSYVLSTGFGCSGGFEEECEEDDEVEGEDGLRDFDLGGAIGVTVGSGPFGVGLRYTNSLSSIVDENATGPTEDFSPRNQVLTASLMYRLGR